MKTLYLATAISALPIILAACGGTGWGDPKDLIQKQAKWINNGEYEKVFQSCTPSYRADNSAAAWEAEFEAIKARLGISKFGVKDINVREEGDVAYVSATTTADGEELTSSTNRCVKIDGVWYDDEC